MDATEQADTPAAETEISDDAAAATEISDDAAPATMDTPTAGDANAINAQAQAADTQASAVDDTQAANPAADADSAVATNEVTADPSPEAAIGASGARSLGDASEIADRAAAAVEQMTDRTADGEQPDVTPQAPAGLSPDDVSEAATSSANTQMDDQGTADLEPQATAGNGAAPTAEAITQAPEAAPAAPAPRRPTYDGPEPTTMEELLNEQATEIRSLKHGDVVEGNVVRIDKDEILVDIGAKSEGVISNRELYGKNAESQPQLNIGDQVLVYVLQPESPEGHAVLSLRRAGLERKWRAMQEQLDAGAIIEAPVIDHNKGGLIVDCGIRGFVPISQIVDFPRRPQNEQPRDAAQEIAEKLQPYVGRKLRLKILEVNRKANRLILSEKVALYEERREKRDELFSSLQVGQKVTGTVRSIAPFGVFVDLGGIDGLVHKSELSWNKVNNPEAGYRVGEDVEAEVIDINHERGRISLSIRRLQPDPWHSTVADLKVGDVIDGTVTKIVNFGAFVRVRDGLEGLIHISELSHARVAHPGDVVHEGQTLKLKIISLDQERHRLGLSLKQAEEAPARPEPAAPRERRPRADRERGYDPSQAVQEPEGGIDNTLAAAFAQVRQQMEETEALRATTTDEDEAAAADESATAEAASADAQPAEANADAAAASAATDLAQATSEPATAPETADAPAVEVGEAGDTETSGGETSAAETETEPSSQDEESRPTRKGRTAGGKTKSAASVEPTEASVESSPQESGAEDDAANSASAAPEAPTDQTDPAEGAPDAAEGAPDAAEDAPDAAAADGADTERNSSG